MQAELQYGHKVSKKVEYRRPVRDRQFDVFSSVITLHVRPSRPAAQSPTGNNLHTKFLPTSCPLVMIILL